jgi:hypothetical protein
VGAADSDYNQATTAQYVEERTLEQFNIIETIMKSLAQTNYAYPANINQGPYKAMVAWEEKGNGGRDIKKLEPWVVDSRLIKGQGPSGSNVDINRILVWITEEDPNNAGKTRLIKAEFKIYTEASFNTAGEVTDYGEWDMNVKFNDLATEYFAASSRKQGGINLLKIHMVGKENLRAILYRAGEAGFGQVEYSDYSQCGGPNCTPPLERAKYAYNKDYMAVQDKAVSNPSGALTYKDRASKVKMTRRYGLFYKNADAANGIAAGDSVERHKQFGFPVTYTDANGSQFGYYGAWQGRHQLWGGPNGIPSGTIVTRQDFGANATPTTYTVSPTFNGTFTKRAYVNGSLADIQDVPFETWINKHMEMKWNNGGGQWEACGGWWDYSVNPAVCKDFNGGALGLTVFNDFSSLVVAAADRKNVNIMRFTGGPNPINYVYLSAAPAGFANFTVNGFYPATQSQNGGWQVDPAGSKYNPANGDQLVVDIGGSIYIEYDQIADGDGVGWQQKQLQSFDQQTFTPTFVTNGDVPFAPDLGREYYINANGVNYVVKKIDTTGIPATDYEVKLELQTTANPNTVASILPVGTAFLVSPWNKSVHFKLETNSASANFMKLVYLTTDPNDAAVNIGDVLTDGQWGLQAFNNANPPQPLDATGTPVAVDANGIPTGTRPVEFNWEYSATGGWGTQQYLINGNGNYVLLSDPVTITVPSGVARDNAGAVVNKPLSLQFDGWMHGLPDLYRDLETNNWTMSSAISSKIISIPADTLVTDGNAVEYYIKPLEVSLFLNTVTVPAGGKVFPDISLAAVANLSDVPTFTDHKMGAMPTDVVTKYSEGNPVQ